MKTEPIDRCSDELLWRAVREGDPAAFEEVVLRHQAVVSGVAYNACGDLALSEDVAQETFWAAWRRRDALNDPARLRSWLCGIARNLAANALRRSHPAKAPLPLERADDVLDYDPDPADAAMSREEDARLWRMLERIPANYREPLILFYRQDQSIAEVAACLDLTEDAVKQRLARGRAMLRDRIADQVEAGLRRSRPGRSFTAGVMAGLSLSAAGAKSAVAAGASGSVGVVVKGALASGLAGSAIGSLCGIVGSCLGFWLPAQMAPTVRERDLYMRAGLRVLLATLVFLGLNPLISTTNTEAPPSRLVARWVVTIVLFQGHIFFEAIRLSRKVKAIRRTAPAAADVNQTALRRYAEALAAGSRGRVYRCPIRLFGLPLLDVQVADPVIGREKRSSYVTLIARGWIAIGDDARGVILAVGQTALGLIAIGGRAAGALSFGGAAAGIVAVGGLGVGLVAVGGLAFGAIAVGGAAIGWQAYGGLALAWDLAVGGAAIAWHGAGPEAYGQRAFRLFRWVLDHLSQAGIVTLGLVPLIAPFLMYRRERGRSLISIGLVLVALFLVGGLLSKKPEEAAAETRFRLDNGLTVLTRPIAGSTQTALVVLYNIGGDHDPQGRSGLAHMVEHVYVTARAGAIPVRSAADFFRRYPAGCNAQTGDGYTTFATVFPAERLDDELREAAARMADLDVTTTDLDRERPRLLDELRNMFEDVPSLAAMNRARELIRPTPRNGRRGGRPAEVQTLSLAEVQDRLKLLYKPRNAILIAAGAIDPASFRTAVARHFGRIPGGDPAPAPGAPGTPVLGGKRSVPPDMPHGSPATVCVAVAPPRPESDLYAPYVILAARLMKAGAGVGGGPGAVTVHAPLLDDPALAAISTSVKPGETPEQAGDRLAAFLDAALKPELRSGEAEEVERMLGLFLGTIEPPDALLQLNPYSPAFALGRREQLGIDPTRLRAAFRAVGRESLRRAAAEVFGPSRRSTAFVGPG